MITASEDFLEVFRSELGFVPGLLAVMGKWEPFFGEARCLLEVRSRAAAALALAESLSPGGPLLISVEGQLRRQPKPGCRICADLLLALGARADRIWLWPAANRTLSEIVALDRARQLLGGGGLLLVTSDYHAARVRQLLHRQRRSLRQIGVVSATEVLVEQALQRLPERRRQLLVAAISAGRRSLRQQLSARLSEQVARSGWRLAAIEGVLADLIRGRVEPEAWGLRRADGQRYHRLALPARGELLDLLG